MGGLERRDRVAGACALLDRAWRPTGCTVDPLVAALDTIAEDARALGLAPPASCRTLFG